MQVIYWDRGLEPSHRPVILPRKAQPGSYVRRRWRRAYWDRKFGLLLGRLSLVQALTNIAATRTP